MTYSLYDKQGRGASGPMSKAIMPDGHDGKRPKVGARMEVGSPFAGTYSDNFYWITTEIKEIISDKPAEVVFRTRTGSEYCWTEF